jgi:putative hydrolase of the HAD superfamily
VRPALTRLRRLGLALAVLTNGSSAQQHAKVRAIGLLDRVDLVVTSEELDVAKPDPRAYLRTCDRLSVAPEEVLHVGDRHDLDVVGARAAGLQALHLDRDGKEQETSGSRIASLLELSPRLALVA